MKPPLIRLLVLVTVTFLLGLLGFFVHSYLVDLKDFPLSAIYTFFTSFAAVSIILVDQVYKNQVVDLGIAFIGLIIFKFLLFGILFYQAVFVASLGLPEKGAVLIPFFVLMIVEVSPIIYLLQKKE